MGFSISARGLLTDFAALPHPLLTSGAAVALEPLSAVSSRPPVHPHLNAAFRAATSPPLLPLLLVLLFEGAGDF